MKRGTTEHPKFKRLVRRLDRDGSAVGGILEFLWHFTARVAPAGDVGRFSNEDIAEACMTSVPPDELIEALVVERWLDRHDDPEVRLVVHGWAEHADDNVHRALARAGRLFADGVAPKTTRLQGREKEVAEQALRKAQTGARRAPKVRTSGARNAPCQSPARPGPARARPEPVPEPGPARAGEVLERVGLPRSNGTHPPNQPDEPPEPSRSAPADPDPEEPKEPAELAPVVLRIWRENRRPPPPTLEGQFQQALLEACERHGLGDWVYLITDRLNGQKRKQGPITLQWLTASDIRNPTHRAQYAEERWRDVFGRGYARAG